MSVVPSRPQSVNVTKVLPTLVELDVQAPEEDGGMSITHYVVAYENESVEFAFGLSWQISLVFCCVVCLLSLLEDMPESRYNSS